MFGVLSLRLQREELTEVIMKLLLAWRDPLWHFHQGMAHQHDFNNFSSNKALEMSDMVHELRKGVEKVAEKVWDLRKANVIMIFCLCFFII